jgi:antirestriction protein ArdC
MNEKTKAILDGLVEKIDSDTASQFVRDRIELFSDGSDIPCRRWSMLNQFSVFLYGTHDARGIRQWNSVGRKVKKGAHALYIFVPMLYAAPKPKKETSEKNENDEGDEETLGTGIVKTLTGYKRMAVFRVEDTEGAPLDYEERIKALDVESLPLIEVAKSLGVKVEGGLTTRGVEGWYRKSTKQIMLGTAHPIVFLHELSHAVDNALPDKNNDYAFNEVVAELSAAFLGSLYDVKFDIANTKSYIKSWQGKGHVAFKVVDALQRVEQIYQYIVSTQKKQRQIVKMPNPKMKPARSFPTAKNPVAPIYDGTLFQTMPMKDRSQTYNAKIRKWIKRDNTTGLFSSIKKDGKPFTRIVQEDDICARNYNDFPDEAS